MAQVNIYNLSNDSIADIMRAAEIDSEIWGLIHSCKRFHSIWQKISPKLKIGREYTLILKNSEKPAKLIIGPTPGEFFVSIRNRQFYVVKCEFIKLPFAAIFPLAVKIHRIYSTFSNCLVRTRYIHKEGEGGWSTAFINIVDDMILTWNVMNRNLRACINTNCPDCSLVFKMVENDCSNALPLFKKVGNNNTNISKGWITDVKTKYTYNFIYNRDLMIHYWRHDGGE